MKIPLHMPGHQLYEYLLVLDPHEELRHKIEKCRKRMMDRYDIQQPQTGRPHVSLVRFTAIKMAEQKIIDRLHWISMAEKPFVVELKDYGGYPMHAVFISIANQPRVLELIRNLKQARRLMKSAGEDPHFLQDPQIALAGRLPKDKYVELMKEYQHRKFTGRFIADAALLLRRAKNEKQYRIIRRFEFQCLPVAVSQGVLF